MSGLERQRRAAVTRTGLASARERFERRAAAARRRPRRLAAVVAAMVLGVGGIVWLGWFSSVLSASEVQVRGVSGSRAAAVERAARVPLGGPLLRLDTDVVESRLRADRQWRTVSVSRSLPHTVVIKVVPRVAAIAVPAGPGRVDIVDTEGVAFRTDDSAPAGIPLVRAPSGDVPREGVTASLEALGALDAVLRRRVSGVEVSSSGRVTLTLEHEGRTRTVVWGGTGDPELKAKLVKALLEEPGETIDVSVPESPVTR